MEKDEIEILRRALAQYYGYYSGYVYNGPVMPKECETLAQECWENFQKETGATCK